MPQDLIRTFQKSDIGFALSQTEAEGWDATSELFEAILTLDQQGSFVVESAGQRIGMITTTRHQKTAWVGNLIVSPDHRRRGVGEALMRHTMSYLSDCGVATIRLEADPPGVKLYRRLGFVEEFESPRFVYESGDLSGEVCADPLESSDVHLLAEFDRATFGDDRSELLSLLYEQAFSAYWIREQGEPKGFAFALPSLFGMRIGPWSAGDPGDAKRLLLSIMARRPDGIAILAVSEKNENAIALLDDCGFERRPSCLRMVWGEPTGSGMPEQVYGIANGAMG